jgi:hypothetical protein
LVAADTFIVSRLAATPALLNGRVYADEAPQGAAMPYVVFNLQGGFDDLTEVGAVRVWANLLYLVKVIGQGTSYTALQPTVDAIDARLHRASGPVGSTAYVDSCVREQPFRMPETTPSGVSYRHLGGLYRLRVRAL